MNEKIKNKVFMENEINRILNIEVPKILEQLKPFINQKVVNQTGQLTKRLKDSIKLNDNIKVNPIEGGHVQVVRNYITQEYDYIKFNFGLCFSGGDLDKDAKERRKNLRYKNTYYCVYVDKTVYLSKRLDSFILKELEEFKPYVEINAEEQEKQIIKVRVLKENLSKEERKINICLKGEVGK